MELVNSTPVPAVLSAAQGLDQRRRSAILTAKATFRIDSAGHAQLDVDDPLPVLAQDSETPAGMLPGDVLPKFDAGFEVMVVGRAHSPTGEPVTAVELSLEVGTEHRSLLVTGDRVWEGRGDGARPGAPVPFTAMDLGWHRAFGGSVMVEIDDGSFVEVANPLNREGRGFDHVSQAESIGELFKCPPGFPRFPEERPLPNIESPDARIEKWDDAPLPVCWAPSPLSSGMVVERLRRRGVLPENMRPGEPAILERAHPDWLIATPAEGAPVRLTGMTPAGTAGPALAFDLPRARVFAELNAAGAPDEVELHPRALVLLPEEGRFCIVFRGGGSYDYDPDANRVARITAGRGWRPAPGRTGERVVP